MASRGRGRPKKPRESRMDAAVDAMKSYGFPEKLVVKSVKYLVNLYGGSEAWPVIEDGYYAILLDYLLKESEENDGGDDRNKPKDNEGSNGHESALVEGNTEGSNNQESASEGGSNAMVLAQENGSKNPTQEAIMEPIRSDIEPHSDITDTASITKNTGEESQRENVNLEIANINLDVNLENTVVNSPSAILAPRMPTGIIRKPRRKPCYGWISDNEDDDFIYLVPEETLSSPKEPKTVRRKSRWDVRPDDI